MKKVPVSELSRKLRIIYFKIVLLLENDLFYFKHAIYTYFIHVFSYCLLTIL